MKFSYSCIECGAAYEILPGRYLCDKCSPLQLPQRPPLGLLRVDMESTGGIPGDWAALTESDRLSRRPARTPDTPPFADSRHLMPVPKEYFPPIPVGETPLWAPLRLRRDLGLDGVYLKDDTVNPTGSLKDRASYLVAAFARSRGLKEVVVASTGNAGSSMAGIAAAAELDARVYLPATAPPAKIVQARQYGATIVTVEGSYDEAYDASLEFISSRGGLSRNTAHNPLTVEGKKSVSLEIFRQLGARMPDSVYVPVGDGVIISGLYKGFEDLLQLGFAGEMPEVIGVQAEGSAAIARALATGDFGPPEPATTAADSISVEVPRGGRYALKCLRTHGGRCITVSDQAIESAQRRLSATSGLFAEPAASAAFAGLLADMDGGRGPGRRDTALILVTGNGLKDIAAAMKGVENESA